MDYSYHWPCTLTTLSVELHLQTRSGLPDIFSACTHRGHELYLSMALQPSVGPWPLFQSVGLLGRTIRPSQCRYLHTGQHKHRSSSHRYPCLKWDSNPRSQRLRERRQFTSYDQADMSSIKVKVGVTGPESEDVEWIQLALDTLVNRVMNLEFHMLTMRITVIFSR
jgi:hypothetical protein